MNEESTTAAKEFLIAEFHETNQEFRRTKEEGLSRLNFYIALTTSILGALVAIGEFTTISSENWQYLAVGALIFLVIVGWEVHQFTINRAISTDHNIRAMARIRRYFIDQDPAILPYLTWQTSDQPSRWLVNNTSKIRRTVQIILALIGGLLTTIILNLISNNLIVAVVVGSISVALLWFILQRYAISQLEKARQATMDDVRFPPDKDSDPPPTADY